MNAHPEIPPNELYEDERGEPQPTRPKLQLIDLRDDTLSNKHRKQSVVQQQRFAAMSLADLLALPPQRWLCEGLFPERGLAVIYGAPGSAKTFLVLDLAFRIARGGGDWFDRHTAAGTVVMVAGEGVQGLAGRARAYCSERTNPDAEPAAALHIVQHPPNLFAGEADEFATAISHLQPSLVVIDTLARSSVGADENSAKDMGSVIAAADAISKKLQCLVLLVHHAGKAGGERGSSALRGASDAMFEVKKHEDGTRELVLSGATAKMKDTSESASIFFKLDPVGESCVVSPADAPAAGSGGRPRPRGANQQLVWEITGQALREQGAVSDEKPAITFETLLKRWQAVVIDPRKREPSELRRVVRSMIEANLLASDSSSSMLTLSAKIWCS